MLLKTNFYKKILQLLSLNKKHIIFYKNLIKKILKYCKYLIIRFNNIKFTLFINLQTKI